MKINFNINFHTIWGQTLFITGSIPELGSWNTSLARPMNHTGNGNWNLEIELPESAIDFEYRYFLNSDNKLIFEEWQKNHHVSIQNTRLSYMLYDYWQSRPQNQAYYSSAFTKSFFAHPHSRSQQIVNSERKILIKILAPHIHRDQSLCMTGNQEILGNWDVQKPLVFSCPNFPEWEAEFDASQISYPIEYKFLTINRHDQSIVGWENGDNRILAPSPLGKNETSIVSGLQFREYASNWKCAGLVLPVFSMRSNDSFGIGDLNDLRKILDWAKATSQKIIQVLPVNDTTMTHTWLDSYPYNVVSIYALHPLYLNLFKMGTLKDARQMEFYRQKQTELNALEEIDYEQVDHFKWRYFKELFIQEGMKTLSSSEFLIFFEENKEWLVPYAAFSFLREKYYTSDFNQWKEHSRYDKAAICEFCDPRSPNHNEISLYYYLQYHLHKQFSEARDYAYLNGIVLKGDIPIGVSKSSIEVWTDPIYFHKHLQAGAPPDDFSITGQNWGFPTYNWEAMQEDQYNWWKKRFRKMSDYFDIYRIDHILGFFRIWEIPEESVQGLFGWFNPSLPLSVSEIENSGLNFVKERFITPHINEKFLHELFGELTNQVCNIYLNRSSSHHFALKDKFNNQQKIKHYFAGKDDSDSKIIQDGLFVIANEVLFIEDRKMHNHFHPRILASSSYLYKELSNSDRYAFDFLYWNYFYQRHNDFWKEQGYKRLTPLISCTDMLTCGEDLGMIPGSVPEVMHKLQILSLEIERMPKEMNREFSDLSKLPYLSVCTTSTHDMSTIRGWWKECREKTQRYYNQILKYEGKAPKECVPEICWQIITNHLNSPSMLVIIPLQDWLSIDSNLRRADEDKERINIPANPRHYWRYRMHLTIEELIDAEKFNADIRQLIDSSNRNKN